jgi:hypothetical protein
MKDLKNESFYRFYLVGILFLFLSLSSRSQIRINEFLASNASVNADADGNYSDWVELYNVGNSEINLQGYFLTDNLSNHKKWQFSSGATIAAKGYLVVWCDSKNTGLHTNFNLSASGEQIGLYSPLDELIDSMSYSSQFVDVSYGRLTQDPSSFRFFMQPTPNAANSSQAYSGCANQPVILTAGGFFNNPVDVSITKDLGGTVRYTLDGSEPTESSAIYSGPVTISKTCVLRARIFQDGFIPGKVMSASYFINEGFENMHLPVVSIATDPANFWDSKKGIYVQDYKPDWEVPVNFELFETNDSTNVAYNGMAGVKINGLYSWQLPQKMLGVYFKKKYGDSKLSYKLFYDSPRSNFDNFSLRASGNDWSNTLFRDGLLQQACRLGNENLDLMAFRPSLVYLNGAFLGIHNIRDKVDKDYIAEYYGLKPSTFDMVIGGNTVENGSLAAWDSLTTLTNKDLSQQANFDAVANCFDVENFSDYIIAELYSKNTSISHNTMAWKPIGSGKWRWVLMDADRGFFGDGDDLLDYYMKIDVWPLAQMMKNTSYKSYFCQRIADQLFTTFNPIAVNQQIDQHQKDIEAAMPKQISRWLGTTSSYGNAMPSLSYWYDEVEKLRTFASGRPQILLQNLTDYGCSSAALLSLSSFPDNACTWQFNQMKIGQSSWFGDYPKNMSITLTAKKKAGYNFMGWRENTMNEIIPKGSSWSYFDKGTDEGTSWREISFDDSGWASGQAPLGYKLSNIKTTVSYGSNSSSKYITTYFRKHFTVTTPLTNIISLRMNLLRDDGAIVYLNGKKILNSNLPLSDVNYKTLAAVTCSGLAQTTYSTYDIPVSDLQEGDNVFAVEVHQGGASSGDLSFDLELLAEEANQSSEYVSTDDTYKFSLQKDRSLTAVYEQNGQNVVPDSINTDMVFYKARSPYIVQGDVYIKKGVTLRIEPGVQVWMAPQTNFYVHGSIQAKGLPSDTILFRLNPAYSADNSWGALCFIQAPDTTNLSYLELRDASHGPQNYNCVAAISAFDAILRLDHITLRDIDSNPIATRYTDIVISNSYVHSKVLGDLTNVKFGKAKIVNCYYEGNNFKDTDGIDFDGVHGGLINNVTIEDLEGMNSDAVDVGGQSSNILIDSLMAFNIKDKGLSVGQRSNVSITNSTFIKTTLGVAVKDSSSVMVDHCTFYAIQDPVACYEKAFGRAGGNAFVSHSILSNSYDKTVLCDAKSYVSISNCISDNDTLSVADGNLTEEPCFVAADKYNLHLKKPYSPAMGSEFLPYIPDPDVAIVEICYHVNVDRTEYLRLYNPRSIDIDMSGYSLSKAVECVFPEGTVIPALGTILVAKDKDLLRLPEDSIQSFNWTKGNLANEGETICLSDKYGVIVDQVSYSPKSPWPNILVDNTEMALTLKDYAADNHLAKYWGVKIPTKIMSNRDSEHYFAYSPSSKRMTMHFADEKAHLLEVISLSGQKLFSANVVNGQSVDLSTYQPTIVLVAVCGKVEKLVIH